jgi:hypothetical protein
MSCSALRRPAALRDAERAGRFIARYTARAALRDTGTVRAWARPLRIVSGSVLLLLAVLVGWLPGPGFIPLALAGGFLVGSEVAWAARLLDRGEARGRRWLAQRAHRRRARGAGRD